MSLPTRAWTAFSRPPTARPMAQIIAERVTARDAFTARRRERLQRFTAGWAALGITLSGATQLRIAGLPVGPAEVVLAVWVLFLVFLLLRGVRFAGTRLAVILGGYWLGALMLLALGALIAVQFRRANPGTAVHDGMAFVYMAVLTTLLALRFFDENSYRYHWHFARLNFLFHALAASVLLSLAIATPQLGPIRFWYGGIRFTGWAENPNQMALAMAAMPFLGWWLLRNTSGRLGKAACSIGIAVCVGAGLATLSDGLRAAWLASLVVISGLLFYRATMRGRSRWFYASHVMVPALIVVIAVFLSDDLVEYLYRVAEHTYAEGDQGEKRFTLWVHGIEAIAASPLFGFGPGAFSGYYGPFEGWEAHNSFIDWGMSTGLMGILMYVGLLAWIAWRALQSRETSLAGIWVSVIVVSIFGYVLRQPDFWTALVLILILTDLSLAIRARQGGWTAPPGTLGRQLTPARAMPLEQFRTP